MNKFCFFFLLAFWGSCLGIRAQGFIKPVSAMPEYNGMYKGSPYTGTAVFTTLYRDNQDNGGQSNCRGEGCGRHPGVDIAVPSGTTVFTPLSGTVMISRCDDAWGGLVVIRSLHPLRSWESVFQVFGHMRTREYSNGVPIKPGDAVVAGTIIGKSGGKATVDPCSGNSTGSHLHYQIDKDDGNSEPWYPNPGLLNSKDSDFSVTSKTYNPIVFLQGGYRWRFSENNNRELWDIYNLQSWGVANNALWLDGIVDPYIRRGGYTNCGLSKSCSSFITAEAADYTGVYLDLANQCLDRRGKIYFTTKDENFWDEAKSLSFTILSNGSFSNTVFMAQHPKWKGIITGLRIDPAEQCDVELILIILER